jgi:hypothetical protein
LPNSHEVDSDFRAGYFEALEKSVNKGLKETDWEKAKPDHPAKAPNLNPEIYEDLAALAKTDPAKAAKVWTDHAPAEITAPVFLDPEWKRQMAGAKETGRAAEDAMGNSVLSRKLAEKVAESFPNEADRERFMAKIETRMSQDSRAGQIDIRIREPGNLQEDSDQER